MYTCIYDIFFCMCDVFVSKVEINTPGEKGTLYIKSAVPGMATSVHEDDEERRVMRANYFPGKLGLLHGYWHKTKGKWTCTFWLWNKGDGDIRGDKHRKQSRNDEITERNPERHTIQDSFLWPESMCDVSNNNRVTETALVACIWLWTFFYWTRSYLKQCNWCT